MSDSKTLFIVQIARVEESGETYWTLFYIFRVRTADPKYLRTKEAFGSLDSPTSSGDLSNNSPHLRHQGYNHKNWSQKRKMSPLSPKSENLCFCLNLCYLIGSLTHSFVKIIPLDHFDVNIDGIISNLEYWGWKLFYNSVFCRHWKMKTKLWFVHFSSSQRWSISITWVLKAKLLWKK